MSAPSTLDSLKALTHRRVGALVSLSLASGLPLGLVLTLVPAWLTRSGVDIKTVGLLTLAQLPYSFKFLWAPVFDRLAPPVLRGKRGWALACQLLMSLAFFGLAFIATDISVAAVGAVSLLISFLSASFDIALDGYAIEVLSDTEQGIAVGSRTALYRVGMWLSGNIALSLGPSLGWPVTFGLLAGLVALLVPMTLFTVEPPVTQAPPPTWRAALWDPFVGFLSRPRALEIVAFVVLYRLADNLAGALVRPFLVERGYSDFDIGIGSGTVVLAATLVGNVVGGFITTRIGITRSLWVFGVVQALSNAGYALLASMPVDKVALYTAMGVESGTSGMGSVAFTVLLVKLTEKRFSATQYALMSSLFALSRTLGGPPAGALVYALGWGPFFWLTIVLALPGLVMLQRFAPWGSELALGDGVGREGAGVRHRRSQGQLLGLAVGSGVIAVIVGVFTAALLTALKGLRESGDFAWSRALMTTVTPQTWAQGVDLLGATVFGVLTGVAVAAALVAREQRPE